MTTVSVTPETLIATEGETFAWNFSLDTPAPAGGLSLFLPITVNNDPAPGDVEYNIDGSENIANFEFVTNNDLSVGFNLTIAEGATEAILVSEAVSDDIEETDESFTTIIADGTDYRANPTQNSVTTTLLNLPTLSVFAEPTEVEEGSQLLWNFSLTEPVSEGGLTVALDLVEDTDPLPGDITYFIEGSENITDFELIIDEESGLIEQALVTLDEGATEATLVNDIIADNISEGKESVSFALAESESYAIDSEVNAANFTILDTSTDLPTVSIAPESVSVTEGETFAWNLTLDQPAPEGGLALSLPIIENNDPAPGDVDYNIEGSSGIADFEFIAGDGVSESFNITIAEGETEAVLVSQAISDDLEEGEEVFTTAIAVGDGYLINPDQNEVTTTILDSFSDLNTTTSTSISFELDDLLVPARDAVVDVTFDLDYVSGIEDSEFIFVEGIADSIENYLANNPGEGDFFEVITEDLGEFLVNDAGLGIGSVAESITVELDVESNSVIPFPFTVSSTIEIEQSDV